MKSVAIIGAGMAGASAARALSLAGCHVAVFDKGRGIGGRTATRRLADGTGFDHGAQYATAHDPGFAATIASWTQAGIVAPWGEPGWSVGTPGMTEPVRALLGDLPVSTGCTVSRLTRDGVHWRLSDAAGRYIEGAFDIVLVTAPAPQTRTLISTAGVDMPDLHAALGRVSYAPCWALMLAYVGEPIFAQSHRRERDSAAAIAWIARDTTKPGRGTTRAGGRETLVVHAAPGWSRAHLEREPAAVAALLIAELRRVVDRPLPADAQIDHVLAHRWRYAMVEQAADEPCLWSPKLRLGVAGDSCLGGRVEAAYLSGVALAERVLADNP